MEGRAWAAGPDGRHATGRAWTLHLFDGSRRRDKNQRSFLTSHCRQVVKDSSVRHTSRTLPSRSLQPSWHAVLQRLTVGNLQAINTSNVIPRTEYLESVLAVSLGTSTPLVNIRVEAHQSSARFPSSGQTLKMYVDLMA